MADVFPFGHFFGFTAAANYAPAFLNEAKISIVQSIKKFDFTELYKKKEKFEDQYHALKIISSNWSTNKDPNKAEQIKILDIECRQQILDFDKLKLKVDGYIEVGESGVEINKNFLANYLQRVTPLFALAGSFSVIMLLITAFEEFIQSYQLVHLNTYLFVCISMSILVIYNLKYTLPDTKGVLDYEASVTQNIKLNLRLLFFTVLSIIVSIFLNAYPLPTTQVFTKFKFGFVILFSVILAGAPYLVMLYKVYRINRASKKHYKQLSGYITYLNAFLQKIQSL